MIVFNPEDVIKSSEINANFAELKEKTDLVDGGADSDYITPTFNNSWVNYSSTYNSTGYFKDNDGVVHLKGLVKNGTVGTNASTCNIFILPVGYRPSAITILAVVSNNAIGQARVWDTGEVVAYAGSNSWFSLDGISFKAEQ